MIEITKSEAAMIRERFPNTHIHKTKHHYYCTEDLRVMRALPNNTAAREAVARRGKKVKR